MEGRSWGGIALTAWFSSSSSVRGRFCRRFPRVSLARQQPGPASVLALSSNHRLQGFWSPPPSRLSFWAEERSQETSCSVSVLGILGACCLPAGFRGRANGRRFRGSVGSSAPSRSELHFGMLLWGAVVRFRLVSCHFVPHGEDYPSEKLGVGIYTRVLFSWLAGMRA